MSSSDEERLRAAIAAAPDDPESFLVYADFLQQQGDPRGELIMVMHAREEDPDDDALAARQEELIEDASRALLGGLAKHRSYLSLGWHRGFIREATLTNSESTPWRSSLSRLVTLLAEAPAALLLDNITLVAPDLDVVEDAVPALEAARFPRLRRVAFTHSSWHYGANVNQTWDELDMFNGQPLEPLIPSSWPRPRSHLRLSFRRMVPRRLPSFVDDADAITIDAADGNTQADALVALHGRRAQRPIQLIVIEPSVGGVDRLATLGLVTTGIVLIGASREALVQFNESWGAFSWAPKLGYGIRARIPRAEAEAMIGGQGYVEWM